MRPNPETEAVSPPLPPSSPPAPTPRPRRVRELKTRQHDFCAHYLASGNAAEAARTAGYTDRYAHNQGHRLLKDARIQATIREIQAQIARTMEPGMILGRLEELCSRAERKGDHREAARILESMSRLVGLDFRGAAAHLRASPAGEENDDK